MKKGMVSSMLVYGILTALVILTAIWLFSKPIGEKTQSIVSVGQQITKSDFEESLESLREKCPVHQVVLSDDLGELGLSIYEHTVEQMNKIVEEKAKECVERMADLQAYGLSDPTPSDIDKVQEAMDEINADHHLVKGLFHYRRVDAPKAIEEFKKAAQNPSTYTSVQKAKSFLPFVQGLLSCNYEWFTLGNECSYKDFDGFCYLSEYGASVSCASCTKYTDPSDYVGKKPCEEHPCKIYLACKDKPVCDAVLAKQQLYYDENTKTCNGPDNCKIKQALYKGGKCCKTTKSTSSGVKDVYFIDAACDKSIITFQFQRDLGGALEADSIQCCASSTVTLSNVATDVLWSPLYSCGLFKTLVSLQTEDAGILSSASAKEAKQRGEETMQACAKDLAFFSDTLLHSPLVLKNDKDIVKKTSDGLQKELEAEKNFALGLFFYKKSDYTNARLAFESAKALYYDIPFSPAKLINAVTEAKEALTFVPNTKGCLKLGTGRKCCKATFSTAEQYFIDEACTGKGKQFIEKLYSATASTTQVDESFCCEFSP